MSVGGGARRAGSGVLPSERDGQCGGLSRAAAVYVHAVGPENGQRDRSATCSDSHPPLRTFPHFFVPQVKLWVHTHPHTLTSTHPHNLEVLVTVRKI